jgi:hypothetical protein
MVQGDRIKMLCMVLAHAESWSHVLFRSQLRLCHNVRDCTHGAADVCSPFALWIDACEAGHAQVGKLSCGDDGFGL